MCGRYYLSIDLGNLSFVDNLSNYDFEDNFNIAPQASVPVVIENSFHCLIRDLSHYWRRKHLYLHLRRVDA